MFSISIRLLELGGGGRGWRCVVTDSGVIGYYAHSLSLSGRASCEASVGRHGGSTSATVVRTLTSSGASPTGGVQEPLFRAAIFGMLQIGAGLLGQCIPTRGCSISEIFKHNKIDSRHLDPISAPPDPVPDVFQASQPRNSILAHVGDRRLDFSGWLPGYEDSIAG
jgi:hypothetical protein